MTWRLTEDGPHSFCWYYSSSYCINSKTWHGTIRYGTAWSDWVSRESSKQYPTAYKYTVTANIEEEQPWEYESTIGKLVDGFDVATSPCYVGDSRYSTIHSISLIQSFTLSSQPVPLRHRGLTFRDTHGQSINSVQCTFPFHRWVYRHFSLLSSTTLLSKVWVFRN